MMNATAVEITFATEHELESFYDSLRQPEGLGNGKLFLIAGTDDYIVLDHDIEDDNVPDKLECVGRRVYLDVCEHGEELVTMLKKRALQKRKIQKGFTFRMCHFDFGKEQFVAYE